MSDGVPIARRGASRVITVKLHPEEITRLEQTAAALKLDRSNTIRLGLERLHEQVVGGDIR